MGPAYFAPRCKALPRSFNFFFQDEARDPLQKLFDESWPYIDIIIWCFSVLLANSFLLFRVRAFSQPSRVQGICAEPPVRGRQQVLNTMWRHAKWKRRAAPQRNHRRGVFGPGSRVEWKISRSYIRSCGPSWRTYRGKWICCEDTAGHWHGCRVRYDSSLEGGKTHVWTVDCSTSHELGSRSKEGLASGKCWGNIRWCTVWVIPIWIDISFEFLHYGILPGSRRISTNHYWIMSSSN